MQAGEAAASIVFDNSLKLINHSICSQGRGFTTSLVHALYTITYILNILLKSALKIESKYATYTKRSMYTVSATIHAIPQTHLIYDNNTVYYLVLRSIEMLI